ncbi:MAG: hypothetical protein HOE90_08260 [Bacteriovoracaceae bacterium]|nr:hypothetical protein [Bacteriovoracaceae bacterium]
MKIITAILILMICFASFAEEDEGNDSDKVIGEVGASVSAEDTADSEDVYAIDHPLIKGTCYDNEDFKTPKDINGCIEAMFRGEGNPASSKFKDITPLNADQIKQIKDYLGEKKETSLTFEKSEASKKLTDYLSKRMEETLFKGASDSTKKIVSQADFVTLYNSQLTKNAILAITSYCLEADLNGTTLTKYHISKEASARKSMRDRNVNDLQKFNPDDPKYGGCMTSISGICDPSICEEQKAKEIKENGSSKRECENLTSIGEETDPGVKYTRTRACEVTNYLDIVRTKMKELADVKKIYDEKLGHKGLAVNSEKVEVYNGDGNSGKSIDELTSITSDELVNEAGLHDEFDSQKKPFENEECKNPGTEGCDKVTYGEEDWKDYNKRSQEFLVESLIAESEYNDPQNLKKEVLKEKLKEKGYSDDKIESLLTGADPELNMANELKNLLKLKRESILARTKAKMVSNTIETTEINADIIEGSTAAEEVKENFDNQEEQYTQLIHFNNVVTSFIAVKDPKTGKESRTNQSLLREVEDSAFMDTKDEGTGDDQYGKTDNDALGDLGKSEVFNSDDEKDNLCFNTSALELIILGAKSSGTSATGADDCL